MASVRMAVMGLSAVVSELPSAYDLYENDAPMHSHKNWLNNSLDRCLHPTYIFGRSFEYPNIFGTKMKVRIFGFPDMPTQVPDAGFRGEPAVKRQRYLPVFYLFFPLNILFIPLFPFSLFFIFFFHYLFSRYLLLSQNRPISTALTIS